MIDTKLRRWAEIRGGTTVEWGNVIGIWNGQAFRETFATPEQAEERKRQALACEAIGVEREPVALTREVLHD